MNDLKKFFLLPLALIAVSATASITISPNVAGFADSFGSVQNGMNYALVFNTNDSLVSFSPGRYDAFDINTSGQFLTVGGVATDDFYVFGNSIGITAQGGPGVGFANGFAGTLSNIPYGTLVSGDQFGVIWFESNSATAGDNYGFITDAGLVSPGDSGVATFDTVLDNSVKTASFTVVPEPSHIAALFGFLALGVVLWRRRR